MVDKLCQQQLPSQSVILDNGSGQEICSWYLQRGEGRTLLPATTVRPNVTGALAFAGDSTFLHNPLDTVGRTAAIKMSQFWCASNELSASNPSVLVGLTIHVSKNWYARHDMEVRPNSFSLCVVEKTSRTTEDFSESLVEKMVAFMEAEDKTIHTLYSKNISGWRLTFKKTEETKDGDKKPLCLNQGAISAVFQGASETRRGTSWLYITRWGDQSGGESDGQPRESDADGRRRSPATEAELEMAYRAIKIDPPYSAERT